MRRLVHISTLGVYDRRREGPGPHTSVPEDAPRGQGRGYGNYKAAKELILEAYASAYGFELIMLRPANVFGLGHFWSGSSSGLKMQSLIEAGFAGTSAHLTAADTATLEYVYAKDVVMADFEAGGENDVLKKVMGDLAAKGVASSEADVRRAYEWTEEAATCSSRPGMSDFPGDCRLHRPPAPVYFPRLLRAETAKCFVRASAQAKESPLRAGQSKMAA